MHHRVVRSVGLSCLLALAGCAQESPDDILTFEDAPLSDLGSLMDGAPGNETLPEEGKADEILPQSLSLMDIQSPVRSQGHRGTCTIFATTALMESLYRAEGTISSPDFSEQHMQWVVKNQVMAFRTTEGSNPQRNLEALSRFGIFDEATWPYQDSAWGVTQDARCTGPEEMRPVVCFTNGEPPASSEGAQRYTLPAGRYLNSRRSSMMSYLVNNHLPIVASGTFFYQAWNHGGSMLPVSAEYMRRGIVLYPNAEDQADSRTRPAGHGILIIGFDQARREQRLDGNGQPMVDASGQPVYETGFFLFKNSWGTGRFGVESGAAPGYGWIAMRYVEEFMTAYVSGRPTVRRVEVCNNGGDDDADGTADCMDSDCRADRSCMDTPTATGDMATPHVAIPDASTTGVSSTIMVPTGGNISSLAVSVDITHTYRGDLRVELVRGAQTVVLVDRQGAGEDNLVHTYSVADFNGMDAAGAWTLRVVDTARQDTGTLNTWSLAITRCTGSCGGAETTHHYENTTDAAIPDLDTTGAHTDIAVDATGAVRSMSVTVDLDHTFIGDLTIRLSRVGGREFVLLREQAIEGTSLHRVFMVTGFDGEAAAGTYRLTVVDGAARDTGTLTGWSMDVATR
jgi:subtilisin-like proprotein convertase family protein